MQTIIVCLTQFPCFWGITYRIRLVHEAVPGRVDMVDVEKPTGQLRGSNHPLPTPEDLQENGCKAGRTDCDQDLVVVVRPYRIAHDRTTLRALLLVHLIPPSLVAYTGACRSGAVLS